METWCQPLLLPSSVSIWPNLLKGIGGQKEKLTMLIAKASKIPGHRELHKGGKCGGGFRYLLSLVLLRGKQLLEATQ